MKFFITQIETTGTGDRWNETWKNDLRELEKTSGKTAYSGSFYGFAD